jgi:glyoxylate reductase
MATALASPLLRVFELANVVMVFLLTVVIVALRWGRGPGAWAAFLAVACFDFFFVSPRLSMNVSDTQYLFTFGLMLAVARRMIEGDRMVRAGKFPGAQSAHLLGAFVYGKTLGLIGGGGLIGKAVARRAHGFSMRVLYWTPRRKPEAEEREAGLTYVPLDELLKESDFVSVHSPLNAETRHQIGARELRLMKWTAFLINTARGPIIDEEALTRALVKKQIAGAGLDVFEFEPKVSPVLRKLSNVVLNPHLGSAVIETREEMANIVVDNILAVIAGTRPPNIINPEVLTGLADGAEPA